MGTRQAQGVTLPGADERVRGDPPVGVRANGIEVWVTASSHRRSLLNGSGRVQRDLSGSPLPSKSADTLFLVNLPEYDSYFRPAQVVDRILSF